MVFQHRFSGSLAGGDAWMFTFWATSGQSIDTVHNAGLAWLNDFWAAPGYQSFVAPQVTATNVTTVQVTDADGKQQFRRDGSLALAGTNVSGSLPADVSLVVSLRTALANRTGRGRFYLPQPAVDRLDNGTGRVLGAAVTQVLDALDAAFANYVAVASPVIYSRTLRATTPITEYNVGDLFDTQRRRESSMLEARTTRPMP